jgi:hypothetical protein
MNGDISGDQPVAPTSNPSIITDLPVPSPLFRATALHAALPSLEQLRSESGVTPVATSLQMFSGARIHDVIQLNWISLPDDAILGYEVERRSQLKTDWEMVAYLRSHGSPYGKQTYSFLDHLRGDGVSYYRLRQIRADGQVISSPVVSVTPDDVPATSGIWQHAVQPFQNYGTVSFGLGRPAEVRLTLHDRYGNTLAVILDHQHMQEGHHIVPFGARDLTPGLYFLRLYSEAGSKTMVFLRS